MNSKRVGSSASEDDQGFCKRVEQSYGEYSDLFFYQKKIDAYRTPAANCVWLPVFLSRYALFPLAFSARYSGSVHRLARIYAAVPRRQMSACSGTRWGAD